MLRHAVTLLVTLLFFLCAVRSSQAADPYNVLFLISDDLTKDALSCYGNTVCQTPNIDSLAARGTLFTRAYCQGTYCGPSRASMMSGFYPHATGMLGYKSPRPMIGDRPMWPQHFKNHGYYSARVSKIFHMGVPGGIEAGTDGADDPRSWTERFNSQGPEWQAPGIGETLEGNPDGKKPVVGGNTFVVVQADGDDLAHSDGRTAEKACQLLREHRNEPFFLGVGFVRPHVPFVAPAKYFQPFPFAAMNLPEKYPDDWADIPKLGINYKTSQNMKMNLQQQRKSVAGYYASVAYMDAQVGKVLATLKEEGLEDNTIVVFTSDHGYHLGQHDFWAKVSLHEESATVPLIVCVPGKAPAICHSFAELIDLYPTTAALCGLPIPEEIQGVDFSPLLDNPKATVRDAAFVVNSNGFLIRDDRYAFMQYRENGSGGYELYDMKEDPEQRNNLAELAEYRDVMEDRKAALKQKLAEVRDHQLPVAKANGSKEK